MIVDSHQHFWDPARGDYGWLTPDLPIHRVYGADDLRPLLQAAGVNATILVQAAPSTAETDYMLSIARRTPWVLGVVGWIDLAAADAADQVQARAQDPLVLGLRPMLQDIAQPDWILAPGPEPALRAIAAEGLVFDALIKSHQVGVIEELAGRHPQLSIVLDHGAKPRLGDVDAMAAWRADMARLAAHPNVVCKLSGLLTELMPGGRVDDVRDDVGEQGIGCGGLEECCPALDFFQIDDPVQQSEQNHADSSAIQAPGRRGIDLGYPEPWTQNEAGGEHGRSQCDGLGIARRDGGAFVLAEKQQRSDQAGQHDGSVQGVVALAEYQLEYGRALRCPHVPDAIVGAACGQGHGEP